MSCSVCVFTYMVFKLETSRWQLVLLLKFEHACEFITLLEFEKLDCPTNGNRPPGAPCLCFREKGINICYIILAIWPVPLIKRIRMRPLFIV